MQRMGMFSICLCAALAAAAACATPPPKALLDAASQVVMGNSHFDTTCIHPRDDPHRPDRMRLARMVAKLPDPNSLFDFGHDRANALAFAVLADDAGLLGTLFARGGRLDTPELQSMAMYMAAEWDGPAMVEALTRHGVSPNAHETGMFTPLMIAAWDNNLANVQMLLKFGAEPNIHTAGKEGNSALAGAVFCRNPAMVKTLLEHGARPDERTRRIEQHNGTHLIEGAERTIKAAHGH